MQNSGYICEDLVIKSLSKKDNRILDFGCGNGSFALKLFSAGKSIYACDADKRAISNLQKKNSEIKFSAIPIKGRTKYKSGFFDCVTMMGVLEHVTNEEETLSEIHRILKKGGKLYIYGLNKGLFGFMDTGNIKFMFPRLHRILYHIFYGKKKYFTEFVAKKDEGMFGDISIGKNWHTHYSKKDFDKLFKDKFLLQKYWLYSFMLPFILILDFLYTSIFRKENKLIIWLAKMDQMLRLGSLSYSFVVMARKI